MNDEHVGRECRSGVTLVEVLVVIVLMGMLAAMLTPALGRARERGRTTACTRNQYQLAFAMARFDEDQGILPGWLNLSPNNVSVPCSWPVLLLPFLGRNDVFDMWGAMPTPAPSVEQFICPSAPPIPRTFDAPLHYAGNAGNGGILANRNGVLLEVNGSYNGVFLRRYRNPMCDSRGTNVMPPAWSLPDIEEADGTSTTLAFSEKSQRGILHRWDYSEPEQQPVPPPSPETSTPPADYPFGNGPIYPPVFGVLGVQPGLSPETNSYSIVNRQTTPTDPRNYKAFAPSSGHPGGVVVAYCDGHTGFLPNTIDYWVYAQLLTVKTRWVRGEPVLNVPIGDWLRKVTPNGPMPYVLDQRDLK